MHILGFSHLSLLKILTLVYTLRTTSAQSPPGFEPATSNHLTVTYGASTINPAGITVPGSEVVGAPNLDLAGTNTTYVAIMMDFSVETNGSTNSNTTFLHWTLPGLSSLNGTTTLTSHQAQIAPYFPPSPPAGQTHTYGVFLYSEPANFAVPPDFIPFFNNLTAPGASVLTRIGFNLTSFVAEAGLGTPVAADWFLVSSLNSTENSTTTSSTSSSPLATQSRSGAMNTRVEWMMVAAGTLGFLVSLF